MVLVADVDLLADGAAVDVQDVFGRRVVVPSNGNLAFAQGMVEQFAAGDDLISLRSRTPRSARSPWCARSRPRRRRSTSARSRRSRTSCRRPRPSCRSCRRRKGGAGKGGQQILSAEQQAEIENFRKTVAEGRLALKEVRKNLRQDAEALVFWTKVINIALVPLLVALVRPVARAFSAEQNSA